MGVVSGNKIEGTAKICKLPKDVIFLIILEYYGPWLMPVHGYFDGRELFKFYPDRPI
jgi:hypothetical protein